MRRTAQQQEQKCEESFWKSCKIDFREMPYNYTMKQCHTPLVKECDTVAPSYAKPEIVCKTWFEAECNTTFSPARLLRRLSHALLCLLRSLFLFDAKACKICWDVIETR